MINTIVFDLGGVMANFQEELTRSMFAEIGIDDIATNAELTLKMDRGQITGDEFAAEVLKRCKPGTTAQQVKDAYKVFIDLPPHRARLIRLLSKSYRLILLSDIGDIHWPYFCEMAKAAGVDIEACFDKIYLSYRFGNTKPAPEFYKYMIEDSGLVPSESLYIDDRPANIAAGAAFGLNTFCLTTNGLDAELPQILDILG